jgi:hypothetical protein
MAADTRPEAVEQRAAWHENEAGAWRSDGGNIALARIHDDHATAFRALVAERDKARAALHRAAGIANAASWTAKTRGLASELADIVREGLAP